MHLKSVGVQKYILKQREQEEVVMDISKYLFLNQIKVEITHTHSINPCPLIQASLTGGKGVETKVMVELNITSFLPESHRDRGGGSTHTICCRFQQVRAKHDPESGPHSGPIYTLADFRAHYTVSIDFIFYAWPILTWLIAAGTSLDKIHYKWLKSKWGSKGQQEPREKRRMLSVTCMVMYTKWWGKSEGILLKWLSVCIKCIRTSDLTLIQHSGSGGEEKKMKYVFYSPKKK